ncbi:MAG: hypothetical protein ACYDDI_14955 [Candidatus Acidiferrales bacterium]
MAHPEELKAVARRVVWFGPPERALESTQHFLAYLMNYGTEGDVKIAREYYSDADFEATLDNPSPGVFFGDAWIKWNIRYHREPVPALPKRHIPGVDPNSIPDLFPAKSYHPRT